MSLNELRLTDTVRIVRPDMLNWELQVYRDNTTENVKAAMAARGREVKPGWRTVGFYSSPAQAAAACMFQYPDLFFPLGLSLSTLEFIGEMRGIAERFTAMHQEYLAKFGSPIREAA